MRISKKKIIILILILLSLFLNKGIGEFLGILGRCNLEKDIQNKVNYYTNCTGFTTQLINNLFGATSITIDHVILTPHPSLPDSIYKHELAHTQQYSSLGPLFLPAYGIAQVIASIDARVRGGTPGRKTSSKSGQTN